MGAMKGRKSSNKNPPIFSHEFVIQYHADIVSCVALIFVVGLMIQVTSPWAYTFIAIQHNVSTPATEDPMLPYKYSTGLKDLRAVFFYFLITIVLHAVFQEFLDKVSKRLHLSKVKLAKFNESTQLLLFYIISVIWGVDIIIRDNLFLNFTGLWTDYPAPMSFSLKLFFVSQLAYWLHCYPELYFQKIKKEDILPRTVQATIGLFFVSAAYLLNLQQVGVIFLVLHYIGDALQHAARLIHFINQKEKDTKLAFMVANSGYGLVRVQTLCLAAVVFIYGFGQTESLLDYEAGSYNIPAVHYAGLGVISLFQAYLLFLFIKKQVARAKEYATTPVVTKVKPKQKLKKKEVKKLPASEDDDLPEVDQATKNNLRSRPSAKAK